MSDGHVALEKSARCCI